MTFLRASLAALAVVLPVLSVQAAEVERFDLTSHRTGQSYRILLLRPDAPAPAGGFPMIVLLDGNATMPMMATALTDDAAAPYRDVVVVGIGYPVDAKFDVVRRYLDLTPPTPATLMPPMRDGGPPPATGGQDDFLAFLEKDALPAVAARVRTDPRRRMLFGHSLAGLFTLHVLFTRTELFQTYVAAEPAIWWNGRSILAEQAGFLARARDGAAAPVAGVLIETAGARVERPELSPAALERLDQLRGGANGRDVATALSGTPGLRVAFHEFPGESHGTMLPLAVRDALPFAFGGAPVDR